MHIFFKFVVFYLLSPLIICSFPFSSPFMEFGIQIAFGNQIRADLAFQIQANLAFCHLIAGWNLTLLFFLIHPAFSKSMKTVDLQIRWRMVFFGDPR